MPKIKTNKCAAKRFSITGSGKIKRRKGNLRHILTKKNSKRKNALGKSAIVDDSKKKAIKRLLPYAL